MTAQFLTILVPVEISASRFKILTQVIRLFPLVELDFVRVPTLLCLIDFEVIKLEIPIGLLNHVKSFTESTFRVLKSFMLNLQFYFTVLAFQL